MTLRLIMRAVSCVVADAGDGPHIVHGPYNGLARQEDFPKVFQREQALIDPMQVNDIGLAEFGQRSDVGACVGDVHGEEVVLLEAVWQCPQRRGCAS